LTQGNVQQVTLVTFDIDLCRQGHSIQRFEIFSCSGGNIFDLLT